MRVLVACEFSGVVRDAFTALGHDAWSCDLIETESTPGKHIIGDVTDILSDGWDLMVAHPPCTYLARSGATWWKTRQDEQQAAYKFFLTLADAPIERIAIENPIGYVNSHYRKPDQIFQPWWFGEPESKATCLWLKGLPPLTPTDERPLGMFNQRSHYEPPGPDRWKDRSRTLPGVAAAMAGQWGCVAIHITAGSYGS